MSENTQQARYSAVAIILHWAIFILLVLAVKVGWSMEDLKDAEKLAAGQLHKNFGMTILLLSVLRLFWRKMKPPPALPASMSERSVNVTHAVHHTFCFLLIFFSFLRMNGFSNSASFFSVFVTNYGEI